jgi:hypothetical protein
VLLFGAERAELWDVDEGRQKGRDHNQQAYGQPVNPRWRE